MIWKTAWKNVWRNKVRSLVVIGSVTIGVFAGVFSVAFMNGMIAQRVNAAFDTEISHIQITGKNYRLNNDPQIIIPDMDKTLSSISSVNGIEGSVKRTLISGMASSATKSVGVEIAGIDPEAEKKIFTIDRTLIPGTGDYFERESRYNQAFIGHDLAKQLNIVRYSIDSAVMLKLKAAEVPDVILEKIFPLAGRRFPNEKFFNKTLNRLISKKEINKYGLLIKNAAWSFREGSRLTLTFLDKDNNQVGAVFRITGLYDLENTMFEQSMVFVRDSDLKRLTGMAENSFHQIILRITDADNTSALTGELRKKLPDLEIVNWKELQPDLAMMTDFVQQIYALFMLIILAALAFGIVNTMLMVVLERTRELGMLTAIGMNKRKVFSMIMLESIFLSLIGGAAGMLAGWISVLLAAERGINFARYAEGMEALGYSAHVFPRISSGFFFMLTIMVILTGVASSVYPALKALKLNPVDAIRKE